ncbi:hypothetical protein BSI_39990 [Bacillus inaquosorum KCTC 13429]|uniref:Uncharacterized protein n=1 Tax=Bacillus inaquosorum KCTC 13429 TaxID=1236548 RepID=A0A9W5LF79_9BACI|nr:hypothetical protein BSI_39990 [Bacillus inaquosorum KCTC 13429]
MSIILFGVFEYCTGWIDENQKGEMHCKLTVEGRSNKGGKNVQ